MAAFSTQRGLFGAPTLQDIAPSAHPETPQYKRPDTLHTIAGVLGDALTSVSGGQPAFRQQLMLQQNAAREAQMAQFDRANKFADWRQQYDYQVAHPKPAAPVSNDTVNDYNFLAEKLGPEEATKYLRNFAAGQPIVVRNPDGTVTPISRDEFTNSARPANRPEVGSVIQDPRKAGGAGQAGPGTFHPSSVMDAVISVESGGRAGVQGPQTPYGRAQGLSQMLPATAQQMAQKLGVPWRPDLMTGTSKQAAAYQRALGEAYLNEGMQKTGNVADALKYYHGGPNRGMWGPKTRKYAGDVLSRLGGQ